MVKTDPGKVIRVIITTQEWLPVVRLLHSRMQYRPTLNFCGLVFAKTRIRGGEINLKFSSLHEKEPRTVCYEDDAVFLGGEFHPSCRICRTDNNALNCSDNGTVTGIPNDGRGVTPPNRTPFRTMHIFF